jgi:choline dehydrogenase-like flavoprotein
MSPFAPYAHCDECGAPAGTTCMGLDDKPAIEVCDDRELAIDDSVARTKAPRAPGTSERTKARRRHSEGVPVMVACEHCTTPVRLWGQGFATGRAYCSTPACQQARRRHEYARAQERAPRPACEQCGQPCPPVARRWCGAACRTRARRVREEITTQCFWCTASIDLDGRGQKCHRPCCDDRKCKAARARLNTQASRQRNTVITRTT